MAKLESTLRNMILSLSLISMGMSAALGFVYLKTKGPIAETEKKKKETAIREVLPSFDTLIHHKYSPAAGDTVIVIEGFKNDSTVGYAIETFSMKGFSGKVQFVVGFLPDGKINNFGGFNHKETPGLGTKMSEPKFKNQFLQKDPALFKIKVKKDGGEVDAISAATISSRAFCEGINKAFEAYQNTAKK